MVIKIQKGSKQGISNNKGSCRDLAYYINHEDQQRIQEGLAPLPYTKPDGTIVPTEEVIKSIDQNGKGLHKNETKFYHMILSPSPEEIMAMGHDDNEIYRNALRYIKLLSTVYAQVFHREGVVDDNDLVIYWKPHYTRGERGELQFHIHGIVSRQTSGRDGKKMKISPLTNHTNTTTGPVQGGFDRAELCERAEKLFDKLIQYERTVAESFEYKHAMAHGSLEEKAEQAERLVAENGENLKAAIKAGIERRRKTVEAKGDLEEIAAILEREQVVLPSSDKSDAISQALNIAEMKNEIMDIFGKATSADDLSIELACAGITCRHVKVEDGVESIVFYKGGVQFSSILLFKEHEQRTLLDAYCKLTHSVPAYKILEKRAAEKAKQELEVSQRKMGGPKLKIK